MNLNDDSLEYAFSGTDFTNVGEDSNPVFDSSSLVITLQGVCKSEDAYGVRSIVANLTVSNMRSTEVWLCWSLLLNDAEDFSDDHLQIEPGQEQEIEVVLEHYDIAYTNTHRARLFFALEDGRRRVIGRFSSVCIDYNVFSGKYCFQKYDKYGKQQKSNFRELDIKVNKMTRRRFFTSDWSYVYYSNTIPFVLTNCTSRDRAFLIDELEFDGNIPDEVIGINDLSDAISVAGWASHELNIVVSDDYISEEAQLILNFTDIATNNHYENAYTYNADSQICKIDYSLVFFHDKFIQFVD